MCLYFISTVLLVSPDEDVPPEVQSVSEQLSSTKHSSSREVTTVLILHAFQAALGTDHDMQGLHAVLQVTNQWDLGCTIPLLFFFFYLVSS